MKTNGTRQASIDGEMMNRLLAAFVVPCLIATVGAGDPVDRPVALHVPFQSVWKANTPVEIPVSPQVTSVPVEVPRIPQGEDLALRFRARLHTATTAGWNNFLGLRWNGRAVSDSTADGKPRLLDRERTFRSSIASESVVPTYADRSGLACLCVFFGPDFETLDERALSEREEGYWYLLDITDLDTSTVSRLDFVNTALSQYWGGSPPDGMRMVVDDIEVGRVSASVVEDLRSTRLIVRKPVKGPSVAVGGSEVTLTPGGGLQVRRAGEIHWFESAYLPPGVAIGREKPEKTPWLAAAAVPARGSTGWKRHKDRWVFEWRAPSLRLKRELSADGHRIVLLDSVINLTDRALGLRTRHRLLTPGFLKTFRFAGVEGQRSARPFGWADNPTLYVEQKKSGVGVLFEDDFFRLHTEVAGENNALTASDEHFGLGPKESYTFRISLYPTGGDFWDFVNAARRDWKVNFTVQGPF
ncbi:MAG: hypothetical protein HY318_01540, partial [Armatimonadetes bacterium]|nr:hypothetical protein [Armatimonadota bacterium]